MGMIPWALIGQVVLGLINLLIKRNESKEKLKSQMLEFIKKYDASALDNVKLRKEYEELQKRAREELKD